MDKNEILTEIKIKYPNFDLFLEFSKDNIKKEELIFLLQSNANIEEKYINHFSILIFDDKVTYNFYIQDEISKSEFKQSVIYALSDLFCDGCDPEDINEEEMFGFFEKEKYKDILVE